MEPKGTPVLTKHVLDVTLFMYTFCSLLNKQLLKISLQVSRIPLNSNFF